MSEVCERNEGILSYILGVRRIGRSEETPTTVEEMVNDIVSRVSAEDKKEALIRFHRGWALEFETILNFGAETMNSSKHVAHPAIQMMLR